MQKKVLMIIVMMAGMHSSSQAMMRRIAPATAAALLGFVEKYNAFPHYAHADSQAAIATTQRASEGPRKSTSDSLDTKSLHVNIPRVKGVYPQIPSMTIVQMDTMLNTLDGIDIAQAPQDLINSTNESIICFYQEDDIFNRSSSPDHEKKYVQVLVVKNVCGKSLALFFCTDNNYSYTSVLANLWLEEGNPFSYK